MIGYYCCTCARDHRYEGECPYSYKEEDSDSSYRSEKRAKKNRKENSPVRETSAVSIYRDIEVRESVVVYLDGKRITLKRTE